MTIKFIKALLGLMLLGSSVAANAALITETWESTIASLNHTAFTIGDTFQWTVTYDDASLRMSQWSDGTNGIAENGAGDDVRDYTHCLTGASLPCDGFSSASQYNFFADAEFDISSFYNVMLAAGLTGLDMYINNYAYAYDNSDGSGKYRGFMADDISFNTSTVYLWSRPSLTRLTETSLISNLISTVPARKVPEPSIISLFAVVVFGLGVAHRRRPKESNC